MGRPRKSDITVTSRADSAKTRNTMLARRLESGNPFFSGNKSVPLKEPKRWHTHIASTYGDDTRHHKMLLNGWDRLTVDDLGCPVEQSGFRLSEDGQSLVRGPKGEEIIYKMAIEDYRQLEAAKAAKNSAGIGSAKKTKAEMAEAAGKVMGDEAGSYIDKLPGQVIDRIVGGDAA